MNHYTDHRNQSKHNIIRTQKKPLQLFFIEFKPKDSRCETSELETMMKDLVSQMRNMMNLVTTLDNKLSQLRYCLDGLSQNAQEVKAFLIELDIMQKHNLRKSPI